MRNAEELSIITAPAFLHASANSRERVAPALKSAKSMSAKAEARSSSIGRCLPLNSTVLPSDRDDASAFRWLTGKFRRSSVRRISCPTAPVAPTTAMRYEFMDRLAYSKYRQVSNPLLKESHRNATSDAISRYRPGRRAR